MSRLASLKVKKMKALTRKEVRGIFERYYENKKTLREDYDFPHLSAVDFGRIAVQTDKSRNVQEDKIINYADRKTRLFAEVFIVDEVLMYFQMEGHGRERFVQHYCIDKNGQVNTMHKCAISERTLHYWYDDVVEKAQMVAEWIGYKGN